MANKIINRVNNSTGDLTTLEVDHLTSKQFACVKRNDAGLVIEEFSVPREDQYHTYHEHMEDAARHSIKILEKTVSDATHVANTARIKITAIREKHLGKDVNHESNAQ